MRFSASMDNLLRRHAVPSSTPSGLTKGPLCGLDVPAGNRLLVIKNELLESAIYSSKSRRKS
jgi:hypothetical protein